MLHLCVKAYMARPVSAAADCIHSYVDQLNILDAMTLLPRGLA